MFLTKLCLYMCKQNVRQRRLTFLNCLLLKKIYSQNILYYIAYNNIPQHAPEQDSYLEKSAHHSSVDWALSTLWQPCCADEPIVCAEQPEHKSLHFFSFRKATWRPKCHLFLSFRQIKTCSLVVQSGREPGRKVQHYKVVQVDLR